MIRAPSSTPHRRAFRHEVRLPCQIVRERDFRLVASRALDLSTAGMRVVTSARVLTGEAVIVSFRAPRTGRWIDTQATVARVLHGRRPGERGRGLGLSFEGLDERARRLLFGELAAMRPASHGGEAARRRGGDQKS